MDRVAFLLEATGERIACLLNPETLTVERTAGLVERAGGAGLFGEGAAGDDPLLATGGGRTAIEMELLFDLGLAGASDSNTGVRALTAPIHALAEASRPKGGRALPQAVRFVWGKAWNVRALVEVLAERFENFAADGSPRRSWMRLRLVRVAEEALPHTSTPTPPPASLLRQRATAPAAREAELQSCRVVAPLGSGAAHGTSERLDLVAQREYGNPAYWRLIATFNELDDPGQLDRGARLLLPPASGPTTLGGGAP